MEQQGPLSRLRSGRVESGYPPGGAEGLLPVERRLQRYEHFQEPDDLDGLGFCGYDLWHAKAYGEQYVFLDDLAWSCMLQG